MVSAVCVVADRKQMAAALPFATPLIAHTAQFALATKEFRRLE